MDRSPLPQPRFQIVARLGEGAFGVVYEALDRERGETIAVKLLHSSHADAVFRFKQEFRSLKDLSHPNLVRLGELIEQDGRWCFTMELVRGTDFLSYVRPRPRSRPPGGDPPPAAQDAFEEDRLRPALVQLAEGLAALHRAGKVHRDVKPSNVRVTGEGRVVLLDFGLVTESGDEMSSQPHSVVGSAAYMSPEQAASMPLGPASDWYSFGVLLYEALTGRRPFAGSPLQVLFDKQRVAPPAPTAIVRGVPADLDALCVALLQVEPDARPSGQEVLARLGAPAPGAAAPQRTPFVGRGRELEQLMAGFERVVAGQADSFYVHGDSGIGKTRLLSELAGRIRERDPRAFVLAGRCHESETVPYKAFDHVVDGLSRLLRAMPERDVEQLVPRRAGRLLEAFPVLARVDAIGRQTATRDERTPDPWEQRNEAFEALRELLGRVGRAVPLVVLIDDLQWADTESTQLLERLLGPSEHPPFLLVAAGAPPSSCPRHVREVLARALCRLPERSLPLPPLAAPEAEALAAALIRAQRLLSGAAEGDGDDAEAAAGVAREAQGHPLFIEFLVRHGRELGLDDGRVPTLAATLQHRIERLEPGERAVLEVLAVAGAPLGVRVLGEALGMAPGELAEVSARLRAAGLTAEERNGDGAAVSIVQERLRETVLGGLAQGQRASLHRRLASALLAQGVEDAEALAIHLSAAGDIETAAHYAVLAGTAAFDSLAFDRAARLFELALRLHGGGDPVRRRRRAAQLADPLAGAGRSGEAADAYLRAAEGGQRLEAAEARARAAQQMVRAGRVQEGLSTIQRLLADAGHVYPTGQAAATASLALRRARLRWRGLSFEERSATWVKPAMLHEVDLLWSVSRVLAMADLVRAADFQARHLLKALDAGEPYRVARALAIEGWIVQATSGRAVPRVTDVFATARLLAERSGNPHAHAVVALSEGVAASALGRFERALEQCQRAEQLLRERCRGVSWELDSAQYMIDVCLLFMGRLGELCQQLPRQLAEASERGDRFLEALLRLSVGYWPKLIAGDPQAARQDVQGAAAEWASVGFQVQRFLQQIALTQIDLYSEPARAYDACQARARGLDRATRRRAPALRVMTDYVLAASCVASAWQPRHARARLQQATRLARRLRRERVAFGPCFAAAIEGAVAVRAGDTARAVSLLNEAAAGFEAHQMGLYAAACRDAEGRLLGGEHGRTLSRRAQAFAREQRAGDPQRLLRSAIPIFAE